MRFDPILIFSWYLEIWFICQIISANTICQIIDQNLFEKSMIKRILSKK